MPAVPSHKSVLLALGRYNCRLHEGVARFAGRTNWHLNAEMTYFGRLPRGWQGNGIIALLDQEPDLVQFVKNARVPVVDLSFIREDVALPRVVGDQYLIGQLAAEHFLERCFHYFAWFSTTDDPVTRCRFSGFRDGLAAAGFACNDWTFQEKRTKQKNEWKAKRDFLAKKLRITPKPLAVFAFRDADAATVLDVCAAAGFDVPEEVAILGTDNNHLICETVRVPLSSINHDLERIGYEGAALLDRLMRGARPPKRPLLIPPNGITVRRSTEVLAVNDTHMRNALQFLRENCARAICPDDAARSSGLPRRKLEQLFKQHAGRSVRSQLELTRLTWAKELLLQSNLSVADIAARTGFNTPQYFSNVFHKNSGLTPRGFRLRYCRRDQQAFTSG